jgi:DNA-binding transcriptional regulator YiaG
MNNIDTSLWCTQQDLAIKLNVTVQCVNNWIRRNKINYQKIGHSRLILVDKNFIPSDNRLKSIK